MRKYKRKTDRGLKTKDTYEKAATLLDQDGNKTIRGVASIFGLSHQTLARYMRRRRAAIAEGAPVTTVEVGYTKTRQVFSNNQENALAECLVKSYQVNNELTRKDVKQFAYMCACRYNIRVPVTWHDKQEAGKEWLAAFLRRHTEVILSQNNSQASNSGSSRRLGDCVESQSLVDDKFVAGPSDVDSAEEKVSNLSEEVPVQRINGVISIKNSKIRPKLNRKRKISTESEEEDEESQVEEESQEEEYEYEYEEEEQEEEDDGDDYCCMICGGTFEQSHIGEEWVQCTSCNKWSHMNCIRTDDDPSYVCINCDFEGSD